MSASSVVPFGKYKGQPIEVVLRDAEYARWVVAQPWVKDRHPEFWSEVMGTNPSPDDTPEHNKMQALFLNRGFRIKFALQRWMRTDGFERFQQYLMENGVDLSAVELSDRTTEDNLSFDFEYGPTSIDVMLRWGELHFNYQGLEFDILTENASIECKPILGDDYPRVLRQMRRSGADILLVGEFASEAVSLEELKGIFATAGIEVILTSELLQ
jgi:hypothetical protein